MKIIKREQGAEVTPLEFICWSLKIVTRHILKMKNSGRNKKFMETLVLINCPPKACSTIITITHIACLYIGMLLLRRVYLILCLNCAFFLVLLFDCCSIRFSFFVFKLGFNCGEAANFGTPQWLKVAKEAAVRRAAMNYLPMLSHQQLLYLLTMSFVSRLAYYSSLKSSSEPKLLSKTSDWNVRLCCFIDLLYEGLYEIIFWNGTCKKIMKVYSVEWNESILLWLWYKNRLFPNIRGFVAISGCLWPSIFLPWTFAIYNFWNMFTDIFYNCAGFHVCISI